MKECKRITINKYSFEKKSDVEYLSAAKCYRGDNGHKMETFFKTLVSKNAATWRLHQISG